MKLQLPLDVAALDEAQQQRYRLLEALQKRQRDLPWLQKQWAEEFKW